MDLLQRGRRGGPVTEGDDERYSAVVELADAGVWMTDAEGLTTDADESVRRLLGYRREEMLGRPISDFLISGELVAAENRLARKSRGKKVVEAELRRRNGAAISVVLSDKQLGTGETITLVTEAEGRKKAESETALLKNEFFALVSHELRTPLTSMVGYLDLIEDTQADQMDPQGQGFLQVLRRNTDRLSNLLSDLILLTQVEGGTFAMECDQTNLTALAKSAIENARPSAAEAGVELKLAHDEHLACWGDGLRIAQVLDNLISNGIKFTPSGGHVVVRIKAEDDNAVIEVEDDGPGIAAEEHKHLFDRFYRAPDAVAQHVQGMGLGLAITKAIVDAHGGQLGLVSEPGEGTRFIVELPRSRPEPGSKRWLETSAVRRTRVASVQ